MARGDAVFFFDRAPQIESVVQRAHRDFEVFFVDDDRDFNLGSANHANVDVLGGERFEHFGGDSGVRFHADADDRHFGDSGFARRQAADFARDVDGGGERAIVFVAVDGERNVGFFVAADILNNHIDIDILRRKRAENAAGDARAVGRVGDGDLRFAAVEGDSGDDGLFHSGLVGDEGAARFLPRRF